MHSLTKFGIPVAAAALVLSGCGTTGGSSGTATASKKCDQKIGMFGALTGPNASLGIYIQNGVKLAIEEYNAKNSSCKVTLANFDSQGDPTQAPGLAKTAIDDKTIVGIVGPAFSGESKAVDPLFNEAGLVTVTPSATATKLSTYGWKTFFRNIANDATQGPAAAKYIKGHGQVEQDVRHRRRVRVRQGSGRHRPHDPRCPGHWQRRDPGEADRLRPVGHQGQSLEGGHAVLWWLLPGGRTAGQAAAGRRMEGHIRLR